MTDGHIHVLSTTPASGKTVITVGLIRALRDRGRKVLPYKPVAEVVAENGGPPQLPETVVHQCFAAAAKFIPEMSPVKVVTTERVADVWLHDQHVGRVPMLGRDMPALAVLPEHTRTAIKTSIRDCRLALAESCDVLVSEGSGAATALAELGLEDDANISTGVVADQVLLVARASNGTAFTTFDRVVDMLRQSGVNVTGFLLNDVAGCLDEHIHAARLAVTRKDVDYVGAMPWTSFFKDRVKYSPPSPRCDEDHAHLAELVNSVVSFADPAAC